MNKKVNSLLSKYGDDDSAIDKCDAECLTCPCNNCKNIARSLKGKNQSLSEDLSYFKKLYYQAQINYENEKIIVTLIFVIQDLVILIFIILISI
jgi:hypothetical protein